jgi:hypothetical protein
MCCPGALLDGRFGIVLDSAVRKMIELARGNVTNIPTPTIAT